MLKLDFMEWWYKSDKYPVTTDNIFNLQDKIKTVLREGNSLSSVNLYDDKELFYIRTSNNISLQHFLFQNGFEEMDNGKPQSELNLDYGVA